MDEKLILEAYDLIQKTIWNPRSINYSISQHIYDVYNIEREDLIQDTIILFMERKHKPIKDLSKYINVFTKNALIDILKYHSRKKRGGDIETVSLDELIEKGYDLTYDDINYGDIILIKPDKE